MRVGKVNVGRPHGIETSHRRTKSGEGSGSQSEWDVSFGSLVDISGVLIDVRLPPKADIAERSRHVCFVPKADIYIYIATKWPYYSITLSAHRPPRTTLPFSGLPKR